MKNYKMTFLAILITAGFCGAVLLGPGGLLHASADGMKRNDRKGLPLEMVITADELRQKQLKKINIILLDARSAKSYQESHVQGALLPLTAEYYRQESLFKKGLAPHLPDEDAALKENMEKYPRNMPIITYCSSGGCQASAVLALRIKRLGFEDVKAMEDGIQTWDKKGYPVESGSKK